MENSTRLTKSGLPITDKMVQDARKRSRTRAIAREIRQWKRENRHIQTLYALGKP